MIQYLVVARAEVRATETTERSARATARRVVIAAEHDEAYVLRSSYVRDRAVYHVEVAFGPRGGRHVRVTEGAAAQRRWAVERARVLRRGEDTATGHGKGAGT